MKGRSLSARLLLGTTVVAVALVVGAALVTRITRSHLTDQVDLGLDKRGDVAAYYDPTGSYQITDLWAGSVDETGSSPIVEPVLDGETLPPPELELDAVVASATSGKGFTTDAVDGSVRYRVKGYGDAASGFRVTAADLVDEDRVMADLLRVQLLATAAVLAALGLVIWWVIRLGVRPVRKMADAAERVADGRLDERVPVLAESSEAGELATSLNTMLERIEGAVAERDRTAAGLRRFIADASHELRSPVTTIRGYAELYRSGGLSDQVELDDAMRRTEAEAIRVGRLVDDLLVLAQLDQRPEIRNGTLDFSSIVTDLVSDIAAVQPERKVISSIDRPVIVHGDDDRLRQAVGNVIGNALIHTPEDTPIEIRLTGRDEVATLVVADRGPGMSEEDLGRATERFYRADKARTRARGGSGLGLAITHSAIEVHGGVLRLDSSPGGGTSVAVRLPMVDGGQVASGISET